MKNNKYNTEEIFKNKFENFTATPPANTWEGIEKGLKKKSFLKFSFTNFNIFTLGALLIVGVAGASLLFPNDNDTSLINKIDEKSLITENLTHVETGELNKIIQEQKQGEPKTVEYKKAVIIAAYQLSSNKTNENLPKLTSEKEINEVYTKLIEPLTTEIKPTAGNVEKEIKSVLTPHADFSANLNKGCAPLSIKLTNNSVNMQVVVWDFGDGRTSNALNPEILYKESGEHTITLTVTNEGFKSTLSQTIYVFELPKAEFTVHNEKRLTPNTKLQITNNSQNADSYSWNFGNNGTSTERNPEFAYANRGNYQLTLKAISAEGCVSEVSKRIRLGSLNAPTGFRPNASGAGSGEWVSSTRPQNNIFRPVLTEQPDKYKLQVFNKRGHLIFESTEYNTGWNGYIKDKIVPNLSVYIWKCSGRYSDGTSFSGSGDVTAIH